MAAEIRQGRPVDDGSGARFEFVLEDRMGVGTRHRVQGVEAHAEARGEQGADRVEVEQRLHEREILRDRIDDLDLGPLDLDRPQAVDVDVRRLGDPVGGDRLRAGEDRLGDALGRRAAGADIVLDPEIAMRPARIVACGEDDPAEGGSARISAETAGVERMPPWPTTMRPKPFAAAILTTIWIASRLK